MCCSIGTGGRIDKILGRSIIESLYLETYPSRLSAKGIFITKIAPPLPCERAGYFNQRRGNRRRYGAASAATARVQGLV